MTKREKRGKRKKRVRAKVSGSKKRPRLSIYRSSKQIFAQLINDEEGKTLVSFSSNALTKSEKKEKSKTEIAEAVGEKLAKMAKKKRIKSAVFDRGGYQYHGRVKAAAEGARKGGLKF